MLVLRAQPSLPGLTTTSLEMLLLSLWVKPIQMWTSPFAIRHVGNLTSGGNISKDKKGSSGVDPYQGLSCLCCASLKKEALTHS